MPDPSDEVVLEVELLIDGSVLNDLVPTADKYSGFLLYWIYNNQTKAVVPKKSWNEFFRTWEEKLSHVSDEIKSPFFATVRGIASPYREKYADEAGCPADISESSDDEAEELVRIANRHYATIKYIIVKNELSSQVLKISQDRILSPKDFYTVQETQNNDFVKSFLSLKEAD
ncbi:hypothetical protein J4441_02170 [Candidatus Micrarchaeota archaeon]|nr:hypothetical protein [Candidatus Micrarchaeota archaeon]